ncbi:MAG: hypothetical protein AAGO57_03070 [Pseudomonadota bacterium]
MNWLLRLVRWSRHPPSVKRMKIVGAVLVICAVLYGIELVFGLPDALKIEPVPRGIVR